MGRLAALGSVVGALACAGGDAKAVVPAQFAMKPGELRTSIVDPATFSGPEAPLAFRRTRTIGATMVRLILYWAAVAPSSVTAGFDAENHADDGYRWQNFDRQLMLSAAAGLQLIVSIERAPAWAKLADGSVDPAELARFATAAASRYRGGYAGLPGVRYWQAWNEPNLDLFMTPQFKGTDAVSPEAYRAMVNGFAHAIHAVDANNVVIAGGLAPFGKPLSPRASFTGVSPLRFMREMLCMTGRTRPRASCNARVEFDIWSHHPYTAGGPTKQANNPDDVSLGDLPEMRRLLEAAVKARHIVSRQPLRFWVTEFSWDSNPPDPSGVPARLHARWVAEAMYRMWQSGVSLVTWFQLRDEPLSRSRLQSGLYLNSGETLQSDRPKLALTAFRFPFVAFPSGKRVFVWGRTPSGTPGVVSVEHRSRSGWKRITRLRANRYGIFTARVGGPVRGSYRARVGTNTSLAFSLARPPDVQLVSPFGD